MNITRRNFIKNGTIAATMLLSPLPFNSCASIFHSENMEDFHNMQWKINPILHVASGCYIGTNWQRPFGNLKNAIENFKEKYGKSPTFYAFGPGRNNGWNQHFPASNCQFLIDNGTIPVIRYMVEPFEGYTPISKGKYDSLILDFADKVAAFKYPIVFIPFQQTNNTRTYAPWTQYPSGEFIEAWIRMHDLFTKAGANENTLWSTKLCVGYWKYFQYSSPFKYIPPADYLDIIGWVVNNLNKPKKNLYYQNLDALFGSYYVKARKKYPNTIQMFWEFGSPHGPRQAEWIDDALRKVKSKYFGVKGISFDEATYNRPDFQYNPTHMEESKKIIRKHFSDPFFIGKYTYM